MRYHRYHWKDNDKNHPMEEWLSLDMKDSSDDGERVLLMENDDEYSNTNGDINKYDRRLLISSDDDISYGYGRLVGF